jgi:tetratricopeptide (TPR) repeat protein
MIISSQLLHEIADPTLDPERRALLRCQLAIELEDIGNYDAAREVMGELWSEVGGHPMLDELSEATAAEVFLRVGVLTGWLGSTRQVEGAQETAKNLISESISRFEALQDTGKVAEAQTEIGYCYWREGALGEARLMLREALNRLPADSEVRAIALLRLAIVEGSARRFHDALRLDIEAAPLFEKSTRHAHRGKFHNQFGFVLRNLGDIDRALIEYAAASYHFEQAGHTRYHACVENNLGYLFFTIKKFAEAHLHLDRAQALFTSMKDHVHTAQVDDTRAKVLLAEGRTAEAEKLVRSAVRILERGGEQSLLAEALTTHGIVLGRMGNHRVARLTLQRAIEVGQNVGDLGAAGLAALTVIEEVGEHLTAQDLSATYDRAAESALALRKSGTQGSAARRLPARAVPRRHAAHAADVEGL